jgi:hypothetical protein
VYYLDTAAVSPTWTQWDSNWFTEIDAENGQLYLLGIPTSGGQWRELHQLGKHLCVEDC